VPVGLGEPDFHLGVPRSHRLILDGQGLLTGRAHPLRDRPPDLDLQRHGAQWEGLSDLLEAVGEAGNLLADPVGGRSGEGGVGIQVYAGGQQLRYKG
jgi:hypothetical protein